MASDPLAEQKPQRILVIIGSGHAKLLRQFLSETAGFKVVDCQDFLKSSRSAVVRGSFASACQCLQRNMRFDRTTNRDLLAGDHRPGSCQRGTIGGFPLGGTGEVEADPGEIEALLG